MRQAILVAAVFQATAFGCGVQQQGGSGPAPDRILDPEEQSLQIDGQQRRYLVAAPSGNPADESVGLILVLHGGGGHTWPGANRYAPKILVGRTSKEMDATTVLLEFFEQHLKRINTPKPDGPK